MEAFKVTYRCDQEGYFCTDSIVIESDCVSVVDFVEQHRGKLDEIERRGTIINIEREI